MEDWERVGYFFCNIRIFWKINVIYYYKGKGKNFLIIKSKKNIFWGGKSSFLNVI